MAGGNTKRQRRRKNGNGRYVTLAVVLIVFTIIISMCIFFKISDVEVVGISMCGDKDVIDASGIEIGSSIFFIRESVSAINIKKNIPYADEVRIVRNLPGKVTIEVTESYPIASVSSDGNWWIIDKNAKILEKTNAAGVGETIVLKGVDPIMPSEGGTLALGDTGTVRLKYLKTVLNGILEADMQDSITWLDMTNLAAIKFDYKNYEVNLGKGENITDKLWLFQKFLNDKGENESGSVDLSIDNEAHYIPS